MRGREYTKLFSGWALKVDEGGRTKKQAVPKRKRSLGPFQNLAAIPKSGVQFHSQNLTWLTILTTVTTVTTHMAGHNSEHTRYCTRQYSHERRISFRGNIVILWLAPARIFFNSSSSYCILQVPYLAKAYTYIKWPLFPAGNAVLQQIGLKIFLSIFFKSWVELYISRLSPTQYASSMALSVEAIIAIIGVFVTLPPTVIIVWAVMRRRNNEASRLQGMKGL